MDDMIYRKDAAKILCNWCGVCPEDKRDIMNCDDICPEFARIPSAQQWIPCSERLPEEGVPVLTQGDGYMVTNKLMVKEDETWFWSGEFVAWTPLPEPYKEDANETD